MDWLFDIDWARVWSRAWRWGLVALIVTAWAAAVFLVLPWDTKLIDIRVDQALLFVVTCAAIIAGLFRR